MSCMGGCFYMLGSSHAVLAAQRVAESSLPPGSPDCASMSKLMVSPGEGGSGVRATDLISALPPHGFHSMAVATCSRAIARRHPVSNLMMTVAISASSNTMELAKQE